MPSVVATAADEGALSPVATVLPVDAEPLPRVSPAKVSLAAGDETMELDVSPRVDTAAAAAAGVQNGSGPCSDTAAAGDMETSACNHGAAAQHDRVAILDCGAQYGKVIDRRLRELKVEGVMLPLATTTVDELKRGGFKAIILTGGPKSVYASDATPFDANIFHCRLPILGICYGFQMINKAFGGCVMHKESREDGQTLVAIDNSSPIFQGLSRSERVLLTHGDCVESVAPTFAVISTSDGIVTGIGNAALNIYGVQFHPEVDLTTNGMRIMTNFLYGVADCVGGYTMASREHTCLSDIKSRVGPTRKALVLVSGGVDSTVCAALCRRALGAHRVIALHIDNGFMRMAESQQVDKSLRDIGLEPICEPCGNTFACGSCPDTECRLDSTTEPEVKRKIIGDTFMKVKDEVLSRLELSADDVMLAQGTLRPDLIESASSLASGHADAIKTHHNDSLLVRQLRERGQVIEPLRDFHKDEVRDLGKALGLPADLVQRHPFPGPGLAIRILCATEPYMCADYKVTNESLQQLCRWHAGEELDVHFLSRVTSALSHAETDALADITRELDMAAQLWPVRTVGVQGDKRSYSYVAALSSESDQPRTWPGLFTLAKIVTKLFHNVNRVVWAFGGAFFPPEQFPNGVLLDEITPTLLAPSVVQQARMADHMATGVLLASECAGRIAQMPVVLVPVEVDRAEADGEADDGDGVKYERRPPSVKRCVCLRPFITQDFMTGRPAVPGVDIQIDTVCDMVDKVKRNVASVSRVLYDLTAKPPGTTEWE